MNTTIAPRSRRGDIRMNAHRFPLLVLVVTICSAVVSAGADRIAEDLPPGTVHMPYNLRVFAHYPDGEDSYPIVTYSWLLLDKTYDNPQKVVALKNSVTWCRTDGQA